MSQTPQYTISEVRDAHKSLLMADRLRDAGERDQARKIYELLLDQNPDYTAALYSLGLIHMENQDWAAAYPHLQRAVMLNPRDWSTLYNLGSVYLQLGANECGFRCLEQALILNGDNPKILYLLGSARQNQSHHASAAEYYKMTLARDPGYSSAAIDLAICYVMLERFDDAVQTLTVALQTPLSRDHKALTYYTLSQLPPSPTGVDLLTAIEELGPAQTDEWEATPHHIAYARGTLLHKDGHYEDAWCCWTDVNSQIAEDTQEQRKTYFEQGKAFVETAMGWEPPMPGPTRVKDSQTPISLFILGPSRAGKTSLESLFASIDGVKVGYENKIATSTATLASQRAGLLTVDLLANLPAELNGSISDIYHSKLKTVAGDARVLTVTHPGAIYDVGRLVECVPDARFIFRKRDEDDLALRIFSKLYKSNSNQFAYNIPDIYEYISQYYQMIDNWLEKLGNQAMLVQYEEMVEDPQTTLGRLVEFSQLKLPSSTCLNISDDRGCSDPYEKWLHAARDEPRS